jgi:hypothetical protein
MTGVSMRTGPIAMGFSSVMGAAHVGELATSDKNGRRTQAEVEPLVREQVQQGRD